MFKCNRELFDLVDLLSAVQHEAEKLEGLINANVEILAKDGFWTLSINYKVIKDNNSHKTNFYRDYDTIEELRHDMSLFAISARISRGEEV